MIKVQLFCFGRVGYDEPPLLVGVVPAAVPFFCMHDNTELLLTVNFITSFSMKDVTDRPLNS
jgi:hypothetical protein